MYGYSMGTLNVYTRTAVNGTLNLIFTRSGNQGERWIRQDIPLAVSSKFQAIYESQVYSPSMSMNNLSMLISATLPTAPPAVSTASPKCGSSNFTCADGTTCIPKSLVCNFVSDCKDGSDEANCGMISC
ncbi:unnamed protein product [Candidula unifasciata]|uniref:MAM domain-containing protein n=1 Tax=Candidula unifasciata TaxID=100452 RepID=A0A8S3ZAJ4_9EUPU|nr:unnamed protein product [Candidula unifasciata]